MIARGQTPLRDFRRGQRQGIEISRGEGVCWRGEPGAEQMTVQILLTAGTTVSGWATQESETCIRIDWGDGTTETPTGVFDGYDMYDVDLSHTFTAGTYTVRFSKPAGREGTIRQLYFGGSVSNRDPIAEIDARGGTLGLVRGGAGIHTLYTGDNSVGNNYYAGCTALETAEFGQPQSIGSLAFDGCTAGAESGDAGAVCGHLCVPGMYRSAEGVDPGDRHTDGGRCVLRGISRPGGLLRGGRTAGNMEHPLERDRLRHHRHRGLGAENKTVVTITPGIRRF